MNYCTFYANKDARIYHYTNYRVAVGLLVGQGWERKRPTLPKLRREKARP